MKVLVLGLGELTRAQAEDAVKRRFGDAEHTWLDRGALRARPLQTLSSLRRQRFDAAVLVAAELGLPRLRLTSLPLGLVRSAAYWRIDLQGHCEPWAIADHFARNLRPLVRHAIACAIALAAGEAILQGVAAANNRPRVTLRTRGTADESIRRILYLRSQLWLGLSGGGSVAHTAGVIGGLQQHGIAVLAISSDRLPGVSAPSCIILPEIWFDGWLRELEDLAYNIPFLFGAWRSALRFRPQAIYQRHTAFNIAGAVLSRALHVPLVLEYNSSEIWKGRYWGGLRLERAAKLVERINLESAARVIVVSRVLRDELVASGVSADRIVVNPNGVDPTIFRADVAGIELRQRLGLESNVVVGFSGTFGAWHGIPTLAAAVPLVLSARPNVRWLLIGDGPLRALVDRAAEEDSDGRVLRTGMVPHAEMPTYLAACDVLVSPHGRQADGGEFFGSPTKLYEYMAAGRPIVASRIGQIAEVLEDEVTALLIEPDDPHALAAAIVRLVDDACLRARLGSGARRAAEQRHTWHQNAEQVLLALQST